VTELATEHPPGGLPLRSPFTDLAAVGRVHYPFLPVGAAPRPLPADRANPTRRPAGDQDSIVPPEQSRAVADAAAGPTTVVEIEADPADLALLNGREADRRVVDLAEQISALTLVNRLPTPSRGITAMNSLLRSI